jgi:WD40 repeat protein
MNFETEIIDNNCLKVSNDIKETINSDSTHIFFHSKSTNNYKIKSSFDINQITKNENPHALLKVKINDNIPNEMALINSNFVIHSMTLREESLYHLSSTKQEHKERINDVCFFKNSNAPFDKAFISGSSDATIKIWDSRTAESIKTIASSSNKKVFSLDTNKDMLVAGMEREIGVWDLKMMKQLHKVKFAHSEDVTFIKVKENIIISGGEDGIINVFDIQNGFDMDSVLSTGNLGQPVTSIGLIDEEINFLQSISTVQTYHILNMNTGATYFEFDAKNVKI